MNTGLEQHAARLNATAQIAAAYLSNQKVALAEVENVLEHIYQAVSKLEENAADAHARSSAQVRVEESITPDYIVCLEDGKKLKMLKRYLKNNYDMTPEEYRKRWNLPASYPMVAPNYAKKRSELAKDIGLGKQPTRSLRQSPRTAAMTKPRSKAMMPQVARGFKPVENTGTAQ